MSVLDNLFGSLGGNSSSAEHPCTNCPSDCPIAGDACKACQPYKEKLVDAIYRVEHAEEIRERYVVMPTGAPVGTTVCPYCGAPTSNRLTCEFCGMQIGQDDGKIYVTSAAEIPNPILEAQDLIYERYEAVGGRYTAKSGAGSLYAAEQRSGILSSLLSLLSGGDSEGLGSKMTEAEILEAAGLYGVTVAQYLSGLDNGVYLPLSEKKKADQQSVYAAGMSTAGVGTGLGYAARRPYREERPAPPPPPRRQRAQERPAPPPARRPEGPPSVGRNERGGSFARRPEGPPAVGRNERGGSFARRPEGPPAVNRNERSINQGSRPSGPASAGRNERSGSPKRRPEGPPATGRNDRSGSPKRRPEGPPSSGRNDRGGRR